jgi:steroid 5-alpha reductase family enzyme
MIIGYAVLALLIYMSMLYVVAQVLKNNGVADIGYGIGFLVVIYATALLVPLSFVQIILLCFVTLWGVRLALRIWKKNYGKPEDFRYKAWREAWGSTFWWRSYLQVYMLQGLVILTVASSVLCSLIFGNNGVFSVWFTLGALLWLVGFFFEVVSDYQLDTFIKNPENKGKIMTQGLWQYSRHPNYFGESLMWWSLWCMAVSLTPLAFYTIVSPLLITYLLLFVSGVPMLEKKWEGRADWEEYKRKTSVFIPMRGKREK